MSKKKNMSGLKALTLRRWFLTLGHRVLVVGNGPQTPWNPDDWDSVIRINNYRIPEGHPTKITHWCTSGYRDVDPPDPEIVSGFCPWPEGIHASRHHDEFVKRTGVHLLRTFSYAHVTDYFPSAATDWRDHPSTGFCLVSALHYYAFSSVRVIALTGFDGMKTGHWDNPLHKHGHSHTKETESILLARYYI